MGHLTVGLFVLAVFASANAFFPLIPEGKELIYHYHGLVRAGSHIPTSYASAFLLDGDLHLQTDKNSSFIRFSGLKYKLYNGEYDEWHEFDTTQTPLPKELEAFEHPFKVVYEPCGHAWGIAVEKDEPQYVVNVKRGIASIFQLYTEKLDWQKTIPYAFHANEHTLYGKGPHYYTVFPGNEEWTVKKMIEQHSNHHMTAFLATDTKMAHCDTKFDEPLTRDTNIQYIIHQRDGAHVADYIESNSGIYYIPHAGEGYELHVYMNQSLTLEKVEPVTTPMTITNEKFYKGLTYYTADFNHLEGIADIFHGRRTYDMDKMLVELEEMLYDTMKYAKELHIDSKQPDWVRGQLANRMVILMYHLDQTHLEAMTAKLMQKTTEEDKEALHVYYHVLPLVGSHASYMYMMKLMKTKKVKDKLAMEWLETMAFHVKEPNKMLIEHMSEMLTWGDEISSDVRKAAILSFGTFVEKAVFRYNKLNHINNWPGHEDHEITENFTPDYDLDAIFPPPKYYEKYVTLIGEKLKATKDYSFRVIYIQALKNMKLEKAIHILWPIVRGEVYDDNYIRLMAIYSLGALVHHKEDLVYEIFWPIMADYKLHTNLRVAAYYNIMKSHPSSARISNIIWQMVNEQNVALYEYHYSYFKAISTTTDPCLAEFVVKIKQALRYAQVPEYHTLTRFYEFDYFDTKYEYGHQFAGSLIKVPGESETTFIFKTGFTTDHAKFPLHSVLVRVDGMEASIFEDVVMYMNDPTRLFNFEKIWKAYKNIYNNKDIQFDISIMKYGQIVMTYHYDATNIKEFSYFLDFIVGDKFNYVKKYFSIAYPVQTNIIIPTEIGFPALFKFYVPKVYWYDFEIKKEIINNMITYHVDTHFKESSHGRLGLSIYNPFIDAYQGVQKVSAFEWVQPVYFDLSINPTQQSMKLSWKRHEDPLKDVAGLKTHTAIFTFVRDDLHTGVLQKSSPKSHNWEMVTFGDEHKKEKVLYDSDNSNTGLHYTVTSFESDTWVSNATIFKYFNYLHYHQNYHTWLGHWFLTRYHALNHLLLAPYPTANGILIRSEVSKKYPVTNIDMNIRFTRDYKRGDLLLFPASKYNVRATYSLKNKETTLKTWDANMILDYDMGHKTTTLKGIFSRLIPGQKEWRVCVDANKKYVADHVEGDWIIGMTHSAEPKCTKDENIMEIHFKGEKLEEQKDNEHMYGECHEDIWSDIHEQNSLECYYARDSFRKWTWDFKTMNMPTEFKKHMKGFFDWLKFSYIKYFTKYDEATMELDKDSWRIVHEYPLIGNKVDMHVYTPENDYKFGGIPARKLPIYYYNMWVPQHYSGLYKFMHHLGWTQKCEVHPEHIYNSTLDYVEFLMPKDWTLYVGDAETDAKHGIFMKNLGDHFTAMKMAHGEHSLEITPSGHKHYDVVVDGKKLPEHTYQYEQDWVYVDWVKETGVVSVFCYHTGSHIIFDGHHLLHEHPNTEVPYYGKCA